MIIFLNYNNEKKIKKNPTRLLFIKINYKIDLQQQ
jgi:hypothetical protein